MILATNMKNNIDDAFIRRFNSLLKFPFPDLAQRALIWEKALPKNALFRKKTLAGNPPVIMEEEADIPEAVKEKCLHENKQLLAEGALRRDPHQMADDEPQLIIYLSDVIDGIKRELIKEGKPFTL